MTPETEERIDRLLGGPYRFADILPRRVPADAPGQYFAVEKHYRGSPEIARKKLGLLLKLNCYCDLLVVTDEGETLNPPPEALDSMVRKRYLNVLAGDALVVSDPEDHYMTIYGEESGFTALLTQLAPSEGLFVWTPEED